MNYGSAMLEAAGRHLGLKEYPGAQHNPLILGFFQASGHGWVQDDETPWCAAFVGAVCAEIGVQNSGSLAARSYLNWGVSVPLKDAAPGDVVVFWRGSPTAASGHVAFLVRPEGDRVLVRGGNQGNAVTDQWYPVSRIIGIRRYAGIPEQSEDMRPTLQPGARGTFVRDLQDQLAQLGYFSGAVDGVFGSRTREAVLAFQADHDMKTDAIVGPKTWAALASAKPRPERDVSLESLREDGSRIITEADKAQIKTATVLGVSGLGVLADKAGEVSTALTSATSVLDKAQALIFAYWPVLAIAAGAFLVWQAATRIKDARVDDARSGRHVGR